MKLVDSSSWVHGLRRGGKPEIADRVRRLVESGEAAWCPAIRLELWNGVGGDADRRILRDFEQTLPELGITDDVWAGACALAVDVVIAACARHHGVEVEHDDSHFDFLMTL